MIAAAAMIDVLTLVPVATAKSDEFAAAGLKLIAIDDR